MPVIKYFLLNGLHKGLRFGAFKGAVPVPAIPPQPPALPRQAIRRANDKACKLRPVLRALAAVHLFQRGAKLAHLKALETVAEPGENIGIADRLAVRRLQDQQRFQFVCREQGQGFRLAEARMARYIPQR